MTSARVVSRNAAVLMAGHALSYVLRVVYLGILARYAGPDGIGRISTATSLVAVLVLVVTFGLDTLLVRDLAADRARTATYVPQVLVLRLGLTLLYIPLLLATMALSSYPGETRAIIGLYALAYVLDTFYKVARSVFHAHQQMAYGAAIELGRDLVNVAASLGAIALGWPLIAVVAVSAAANLLKLVVGLAILRRRFTPLTLRVRVRDAVALLGRAVPFAAVLALGVIYAQLNTVILSWRAPSEIVGLFGAAAMPVSILLLVPSTVMESILPAFSEYRHTGDGNLARAYQTSFKLLLVLGTAVGAGVIVVAPNIVRLVFGSAFDGAVPALRILSVQLLTMVGYINGALLFATDRQALFARVRVALTVLNAVLCLVLIPPLGYLGAAIAAVVPGVIDFFLYTALCHRQLGFGFPWHTLLKVSTCAGVMAGVSGLALGLGLPLLVVVALLAPLVYGGMLHALRVLDRGEYRFLERATPLGRWRRSARMRLGIGGN